MSIKLKDTILDYIDKAYKDSSGNTISSTYLKKSGDILNIINSQYYISSNYGINMNNSDIIGANSIYFLDTSNSAAEGLSFARDNGNWDVLRAENGILKFTTNVALGNLSTTTTYNTIYHNGNISTIKTDLGLGSFAYKNSLAFSEITSKPTTLSGYGITDGAEKSHTHTYLPLSGGSLTGPLTLLGSQYTGNFALNLSNSDIIGVNAIYTTDNAEGGNEGIQFKRNDGNYDSIWASAGVLYFSPNGNNSSRTGSYSTNNIVLHSGNWSSYCASSSHNHNSTYAYVGGSNASGTWGINISGSAGSISKVSGGFTVSSAGWYKLAKYASTDSRGSVRLALVTTGGNYTPRYTEVKFSEGWSDIIINQNGQFNWISDYRYTKDESNCYIEAYFKSACTFTIYKLSGESYVDDRAVNWTLYTSATAGSGNVMGSFVASPSSSLYSNKLIASGGGFHSVGYDNNYILLAGSGHKAISDFATANHTHSYLPLSGGTLTGKLTISYSTAADMSTTSSNPQIVFAENGTQPVQLMYTDYDSYRSPAGLKLLGNQGGEWFEVAGKTYSAGFVKTSSSDSYILLGGGGHKAVSDFATASHTHNYAAASHTHSYLPLSGGTLTGGIAYAGSKATYTMISFIDNTADNYGNGIMIGGGGATIVGGGEAASAAAGTLGSGGDEKLILCNDGNIDFYTNCQNGISSSTHTYIDSNGNFSGNASSASSVAWGNVSGKPSTFTPSSHTHDYLPLSGGTMTGTIVTPGNDTIVIKPAKNNYDQIGGEGIVFWKIFATNFYGTLQGSCTGSAGSVNGHSFETVTSLPSSPNSGTVYFVTG